MWSDHTPGMYNGKHQACGLYTLFFSFFFFQLIHCDKYGADVVGWFFLCVCVLKVPGEGVINKDLPSCWECPKCVQDKNTEVGCGFRRTLQHHYSRTVNKFPFRYILNDTPRDNDSEFSEVPSQRSGNSLCVYICVLCTVLV